MEILNDINQLSQKTYNEYLKNSKVKDGKKIIGYFCAYVPPEIIHAAGFIPYRMRAVENQGTAMGDTYFSIVNCSFVRHCLDKALRNDFDFLDGVTFMNGCDDSRRMYDNWRMAEENIGPDFTYMLTVPHTLTDFSLTQYIKELNEWKKSIEENFQVKITDDALRESIRLYNMQRDLLSEIYQTRKQKNPPISGSEVLSIILAVTAMPVEDAIELLQKVVKGLQDRNISDDNNLRIFFMGDCMEEVDFMEMVEQNGISVIADKICLGSNEHDTKVNENENDPIAAIAERYLNHLSCPRMADDYKRKLEYIKSHFEEYSLDAVIMVKLRCCVLSAVSYRILHEELEKLKIPALILERELYDKGVGQAKTRIQAFCEQVTNLKKV